MTPNSVDVSFTFLRLRSYQATLHLAVRTKEKQRNEQERNEKKRKALGCACRAGRGSSAPGKVKSNTYSYDAVYEPGSSQEAVFSDVEPVVTSVMDGYNVCIFAYGQTGACNIKPTHVCLLYIGISQGNDVRIRRDFASFQTQEG